MSNLNRHPWALLHRSLSSVDVKQCHDVLCLSEEMSIYTVEITSNACEFPYEKKFPAITTLGGLKKKLELVVGAVTESMRVELRDENGKFVATLSDDSKSLQALGVRDHMRIHVIDTSGGNEELQDASMLEKYEMDDKKYDKRQDSARNWKKKLVAAGDLPQRSEEEVASSIQIGDRSEVRITEAGPRRGRVAFKGETKFSKGLWIGVHYDEPVGKNDGSVAGIRYFECMDKHGGFVRPAAVTQGDFPPLPIDNEMDEI